MGHDRSPQALYVIKRARGATPETLPRSTPKRVAVTPAFPAAVDVT